MSDQHNADNWRLEESGDTSGRWRLEEAEQNQLTPWELQEEFYEEAGWQPVEYTRGERNQGGGWVLPSLVGLALIAVVAYGVWIGLTRLPAGTIGTLLDGSWLTPVATADVGSTIAAATTPEPPTEEAIPTDLPPATATEVPPTPTEVPTAMPTSALVAERFVTITSQYGVNARPNPVVEGDPLEVLAEGQEYLVIDENDGWLQIALPSRQLAWISSDPQFVNVRSEEMTVDRANQFRNQVGAPALPGGSVASLPPVEDRPSLTTTAPISDTAPVEATATVEPDLTTPVVEAATITGTVNITAGLNARTEPSTSGELVALLANNTLLTLTARTADNAWLRSTLSDSIEIWVFAEFILVDGEVNTLPVVDVPGISAQERTPITGTLFTTNTTSVDTETVATAEPTAPATPEPADEPSTVDGATASVTSLLGTAVRAAPDGAADALATAIYENVLTVIGRSADNNWLQVDLGEQQGWVQVSAVDLSVAIATLPVTSP